MDSFEVVCPSSLSFPSQTSFFWVNFLAWIIRFWPVGGPWGGLASTLYRERVTNLIAEVLHGWLAGKLSWKCPGVVDAATYRLLRQPAYRLLAKSSTALTSAVWKHTPFFHVPHMLYEAASQMLCFWLLLTLDPAGTLFFLSFPFRDLIPSSLW